MKILVSGLINIETTLKIESFPVFYSPVQYPFFGVNSTVSGVGYNVAKALAVLGCETMLLSLIGSDGSRFLVFDALEKDSIPDGGVLSAMKETPQSVILYDAHGRRQIHVDLKNIQDQKYPPDIFKDLASGISVACICNINFSRALLSPAKKKGMKIATDVHVISAVDDDYNKDFMNAADILFLSNEALQSKEADFIRKLKMCYPAEVICMGMGNDGAMMYTRKDDTIRHFNAFRVREIASTVGAGDALFSCFVFNYANGMNYQDSMKRAMLFASYKIGEKSAAEGFLSSQDLEELAVRNQGNITARVIR